jgi:hypothetical protein
MSMDLEVWSTREFNFPAELPRPTSWKRYNDEFAFEQERWQVLVLAEEREPDPPVVQKLPGAKFVAGITLEPIGAEDDGYDFLEAVVRSVAREVGGVWVDPYGSAYFHNEGQF